MSAPPPVQVPLRLAVAIATSGRAALLRQILPDIVRQTRKPDRVLVCGAQPGDVADLAMDGNLEILLSRQGSTFQRNVMMDALDDCDIVLFLDDDFVMAPRYIAATISAFEAHPDIVVTTGWTIADGVKGPGIPLEEARLLIANDPDAERARGMEPAPHGYGCNMAIRLATVRQHGIRFDERLPLYGWSEDMDFTHCVGRHGRIVKLLEARGVHLGHKRGRTSGRRLGYSQVANPLYLRRKGSYSWGRALRSVGRNMAMNALKALKPEPWIDRRGRLLGNAIALGDMLRGRLAPERILDL